ncbi:MAG: cell division protein [Gammaproteobacteria bacterium]|nr:cell division protein [Gammaproteobacteria bacterium]
MARDYKRRAAPARKKQKQPNCWIWLLAGLLVGGFGTSLVWMKLGPLDTGQLFLSSGGGDSKLNGTSTRSARKPAPDAAKPRFDFYTILPEMEVVVTDLEDEPASRPRKAVTQGKPVSKPAGAYMVQVGSFRNYDDADRLKASLALVGIKAEIQKVKSGGKTYNRVRSGPYSLEQAKKLRSKLAQNKIDSLVLKLR